ncbi:hypothetical protein ACU4GD_35265 [Cupriavidus basilensis]
MLDAIAATGRAAARFVGKQRCVMPTRYNSAVFCVRDALSDLLEHQFIALFERCAVGFVELVLPAPDGWYARASMAASGCARLASVVRLEKTLMYLRELGCARAMVDLSAEARRATMVLIFVVRVSLVVGWIIAARGSEVREGRPFTFCGSAASKLGIAPRHADGGENGQPRELTFETHMNRWFGQAVAAWGS